MTFWETNQENLDTAPQLDKVVKLLALMAEKFGSEHYVIEGANAKIEQAMRERDRQERLNLLFDARADLFALLNDTHELTYPYSFVKQLYVIEAGADERGAEDYIRQHTKPVRLVDAHDEKLDANACDYKASDLLEGLKYFRRRSDVDIWQGCQVDTSGSVLTALTHEVEGIVDGESLYGIELVSDLKEIESGYLQSGRERSSRASELLMLAKIQGYVNLLCEEGYNDYVEQLVHFIHGKLNIKKEVTANYLKDVSLAHRSCCYWLFCHFTFCPRTPAPISAPILDIYRSTVIQYPGVLKNRVAPQQEQILLGLYSHFS